VATPPEVVAVEVDGGRLRTRAPQGGPGGHAYQNKQAKVACLVTLQGAGAAADPQPEPPAALLQPRRVQRLVQQMHGQAADPAPDTAAPAEPPADAAVPDAGAPSPVATAAPGASPRRLVRTCVASMAACQAFGPMRAAEAQERNFYQARRRAFLGAGAAYNWGMQRG
jgi:hypothetical protein